MVAPKDESASTIAVTLNDVAAQAGVSPATVSRCLNDPQSVRADKRDRVMLAVDALGYVPHGAARALASRRSNMIGAVFPSLDSTLFGGMLEALQVEVAKSGYTLVVASTGFDLEKEVEDVRNLLVSGVDALTLVGGAHDPRTFEMIKRKGIPYVLNWNATSSPDHPSVGFDNRKAAAQVTQYLLDLGHTRFGMIGGERDNNDRAEMRYRGVVETLAARGLTIDPAHRVERPFTTDDGREAFRLIMQGVDRPTAVICGSDPFAYGAIFEAQALGIDVPGDVSITGFDDMWLAAHIQPGLTTIQTPRREIGTEVGKYLLAKLNDEQIAEPAPLETRLIVRGSSGPVPR